MAIWQQSATVIVAAILSMSTGDVSNSASVSDNDAYLANLAAWKTQRVENLKGSEGFLNLVGLFWMRQDAATFGSSSDSDFVLPGHAPAMLGSFHRENDRIRMSVQDGVGVLNGETPIRSIVMQDDLSADPVVLTHGSLAWTVIRRDDKFAVRVRDFEHPAIDAFQPIDYFPVDLTLRVPAVLELFDEPKQMRVDTVITGLDYRPMSPGKLNVRHETVAGVRVVVAAPVGHNVRRLDMLAMLNWTLPDLVRLLPDFPRRLKYSVTADQPSGRSNISLVLLTDRGRVLVPVGGMTSSALKSAQSSPI